MRPFTSFCLLLMLSFLLHRCTSTQQDTRLETNRAVVKKYHDIWSNGQVAKLDQVLAPDYILHLTNGKDEKGIDSAKAYLAKVRKAIPDLNDDHWL